MIILFSVALLAIGFSQIKTVSEPTKIKLERAYEKVYSFSFKIFGALMLLAISFNIAKFFAPIIKNLDLQSIELIIIFIG